MFALGFLGWKTEFISSLTLSFSLKHAFPPPSAKLLYYLIRFEGTALTADLSEWRVESVTNFRNMFMDTPQYSQQLCWNVSIGARTDQMFNGTPACLEKKCVIEEIYKESGCSAAPSWMAVPSTWAIMAATGLMGLMVQQF